MASRDFNIPFGPDLTNGEGFEPIPAEGEEVESSEAPLAAEAPAETGALRDATAPIATDAAFGAQATQANQKPYVPPVSYDGRTASGMPITGASQEAYQEPSDPGTTSELNAQGLAALGSLNVAVANTTEEDPVTGETVSNESYVNFPDEDDESLTGGLTEEELAEQGMDDMQVSILALKDSIGQGRELKAREKEREELAEALELDHEELSDRENILANYPTLVAEQDEIINRCTQQREGLKAELAQATAQLDETEAALERMREYHDQQMQPIEHELGRVRALADRAKNDERSRKSEMNSAENELRRADDSNPNTLALSLYHQAKEDYEQARKVTERAREQLSEVQGNFDNAKQQAQQAEEPLEHNIEDLNARIEKLKETIAELADEITAATKRRQYCDTVYQYPDETAKMRSEVESAEEAARQMDAENDALRQKLEKSKKKAVKAKVAIGIVIAIVVVFIIALIVVTNR